MHHFKKSQKYSQCCVLANVNSSACCVVSRLKVNSLIPCFYNMVATSNSGMNSFILFTLTTFGTQVLEYQLRIWSTHLYFRCREAAKFRGKIHDVTKYKKKTVFFRNLWASPRTSRSSTRTTGTRHRTQGLKH